MKLPHKYSDIWNEVKLELRSSLVILDHTLRVYNNCLVLLEHYQKADKDVLLPAALMHDVARIKSRDQGIAHSDMGAKLSEDILLKTNYDKSKIKDISSCILTHSMNYGPSPKSLEEKILFDADKIDWLGEVGIAKIFMHAGSYNQRLYKMVDLIDNENNITLEDNDQSPFFVFENEIMQFPDKIYTTYGKEIAYERLYIMKNFFDKIKEQNTIN